MQLNDLYELFLKEKTYLKGVSALTIKSNRLTWLRWSRTMGNLQLSDLNKELLKDFVAKLQTLKLSPVTCNITIREINGFLTWLHEEEYLPVRLKMKQLKVEKKVYQDFSDEDVKKLLAWKPKGFFQFRLSALIHTLTDTGIRIDEALTLTREWVDLDNLILLVKGKGSKERVVPFSLELRKVLFKWFRQHKHSLVFCTRRGGKLSYNNMLRELKNLAADLGITNERIGYHQFRYGFALNYIRSKGDPFRLQRVMGHASITTTQGYVRLVAEDLKEAHLQTSRLTHLKEN